MAAIPGTGRRHRYHARGCVVYYGPKIEAVCLTKTGARIKAWRLRRAFR